MDCQSAHITEPNVCGWLGRLPLTPDPSRDSQNWRFSVPHKDNFKVQKCWLPTLSGPLYTGSPSPHHAGPSLWLGFPCGHTAFSLLTLWHTLRNDRVLVGSACQEQCLPKTSWSQAGGLQVSNGLFQAGRWGQPPSYFLRPQKRVSGWQFTWGPSDISGQECSLLGILKQRGHWQEEKALAGMYPGTSICLNKWWFCPGPALPVHPGLTCGCPWVFWDSLTSWGLAKQDWGSLILSLNPQILESHKWGEEKVAGGRSIVAFLLTANVYRLPIFFGKGVPGRNGRGFRSSTLELKVQLFLMQVLQSWP